MTNQYYLMYVYVYACMFLYVYECVCVCVCVNSHPKHLQHEKSLKVQKCKLYFRLNVANFHDRRDLKYVILIYSPKSLVSRAYLYLVC